MSNPIQDLFEQSKIRITDNYPKNVEIIKIGDQVVGTLGNISASVGKAKSRKSFNISAIAANAISKIIDGEVGYSVQLPDLKNSVILVDTEQGKYHCYKELLRIISISLLSKSQQPDNFHFLALRRFNLKTRNDIIDFAIKNTSNLGLVIIDGVRDLVSDINDSRQCSELITHLMALSETYNIHIHLVLHMNKDSNSVRGHLGTELVNKSESIISIEKNEDGYLSIVKPLFSRNRDFEEFAFYVDDNGIPHLDENYQPTGSINKKKTFVYEDLNEAQHRAALSFAFKEYDSFKTALELKKALKEAYTQSTGQSFGDNKAQDLKVFLENKRMILKDDSGFRFNEKFIF